MATVLTKAFNEPHYLEGPLECSPSHIPPGQKDISSASSAEVDNYVYLVTWQQNVIDVGQAISGVSVQCGLLHLDCDGLSAYSFPVLVLLTTTSTGGRGEMCSTEEEDEMSLSLSFFKLAWSAVVANKFYLTSYFLFDFPLQIMEFGDDDSISSLEWVGCRRGDDDLIHFLSSLLSLSSQIHTYRCPKKSVLKLFRKKMK